jgi:ABC-type uncharacterized transport system substrate-binding protein
MKKAGVLSILFVVALLAVAVIGEAQQPKKVPRIGYLAAGDAASESTREVRAVDDFERVFAAQNKQRPDGLYVPAASPLMTANRKRIAGLASKSQLPSMHGSREYVEAGGLMSYGADRVDIYRCVAYFVDRILKGAAPADLPVEQPKKFELVINLKTAKQIGLTIPQRVLARADKVIK